MGVLADVWRFVAGNAVEISTAATAIFTGLMAWVAWRQSRDRLIAEWDFSSVWSDPIAVRVTIRNGLRHSIKPSVIESSKRFVRDLQPNHREPKHSSWGPNRCPVVAMNPIEPNQSQTISFKVSPDWLAVHRQQQQFPARLRRWLAKVAWKSLSARVHHGASVHFHITIDSNVSTSFRKRIKATMRIPLTAAEKHITDNAKTENKS